MEKLRFDFADSTMRTDGSERLELSLLISSGTFSFFVSDEKNRVRVLKSWQLESTNGAGFQERRLAMARIVASQSVLEGRFMRSTCGIANPWVSLVPDKIFDEAHLPAYLNLLLDGDREKFSFFAEKLPGMPIRLVWAAEKDVVFFCQNNFPGSLMRHSASGLIESWKELASPYSPEIYVNVQGKTLQMAMFDRGELQLFNTFSYNTSADFLYYVMLAFEQFRLDPGKIPLFLSGELLPDSEIWRMLYRFILDIRFLPRPARFVHPLESLELPGHINFDLLSI